MIVVKIKLNGFISDLIFNQENVILILENFFIDEFIFL